MDVQAYLWYVDLESFNVGLGVEYLDPMVILRYLGNSHIDFNMTELVYPTISIYEFHFGKILSSIYCCVLMFWVVCLDFNG